MCGLKLSRRRRAADHGEQMSSRFVEQGHLSRTFSSCSAITFALLVLALFFLLKFQVTATGQQDCVMDPLEAVKLETRKTKASAATESRVSISSFVFRNCYDENLLVGCYGDSCRRWPASKPWRIFVYTPAYAAFMVIERFKHGDAKLCW